MRAAIFLISFLFSATPSFADQLTDDDEILDLLEIEIAEAVCSELKTNKNSAISESECFAQSKIEISECMREIRSDRRSMNLESTKMAVQDFRQSFKVCLKNRIQASVEGAE